MRRYGEETCGGVRRNGHGGKPGDPWDGVNEGP